MKTLKKVLLPVVFLVTSLLVLPLASPAVAQGPAGDPPTIGEIAIAVNAETGEFSTLIAALVKTGLVAVVLDETQDLTVFAPTDKAFEQIGLDADAIDGLDPIADADQIAFLAEVLLYHVKAGGEKLRAIGGTSRPEAVEMLNEEFTYVLFRRFINQARFVQRFVDVRASNGYLNVIDRVLLPSAVLAN